MSTRIVILFVISLCTLLFASGSPITEQGSTKIVKPRKRTRALAKITVQNSESNVYDQTVGLPLTEVRINETFIGDIEGRSTVRALQLQREDKYATLVSMQRFEGKLRGRAGTFVLQGSETVDKGKI